MERNVKEVEGVRCLLPVGGVYCANEERRSLQSGSLAWHASIVSSNAPSLPLLTKVLYLVSTVLAHCHHHHSLLLGEGS